MCTESVFIANGGFSRVIAVSEQDGGAYADELSSICGEARLTVICTASQTDNDTGSSMEVSAVEFIYAAAEKLRSENFGYFENADIPREG